MLHPYIWEYGNSAFNVFFFGNRDDLTNFIDLGPELGVLSQATGLQTFLETGMSLKRKNIEQNSSNFET